MSEKFISPLNEKDLILSQNTFLLHDLIEAVENNNLNEVRVICTSQPTIVNQQNLVMHRTN
jgi:hypothetical protein